VPGIELEPPVLTGGEVAPPLDNALEPPPDSELAPPGNAALAPPLDPAFAPPLDAALAPPEASGLDALPLPPLPVGPGCPLELVQAAARTTASEQITSLQRSWPLNDGASAC